MRNLVGNLRKQLSASATGRDRQAPAGYRQYHVYLDVAVPKQVGELSSGVGSISEQWSRQERRPRFA